MMPIAGHPSPRTRIRSTVEMQVEVNPDLYASVLEYSTISIAVM